MCGSVSSATVVSTTSCGVARRAERHKALERESPRGAQPTGIPAGGKPDARNGELARRTPGMVGAERRERPQRRAGRAGVTQLNT